MSQTEFAEKTGVHRNTQVRYESDKREPDAAYWDAVEATGINVQYVKTGEKKLYSLADKDPDLDLLAKVVEGVESVLIRSEITLSPDKKARTVVFLYKTFRQSGTVEIKKIKDAVFLASA